MSITAMKQALEALENVRSYDKGNLYGLDENITALNAAIEQAEKQEPVEQFYPDMGKSVQWVGLTDEQINQYDYQYRDLLYDVEKMLRENNA